MPSAPLIRKPKRRHAEFRPDEPTPRKPSPVFREPSASPSIAREWRHYADPSASPSPSPSPSAMTRSELIDELIPYFRSDELRRMSDNELRAACEMCRRNSDLLDELRERREGKRRFDEGPSGRTLTASPSPFDYISAKGDAQETASLRDPAYPDVRGYQNAWLDRPERILHGPGMTDEQMMRDSHLKGGDVRAPYSDTRIAQTAQGVSPRVSDYLRDPELRQFGEGFADDPTFQRVLAEQLEKDTGARNVGQYGHPNYPPYVAVAGPRPRMEDETFYPATGRSPALPRNFTESDGRSNRGILFEPNRQSGSITKLSESEMNRPGNAPAVISTQAFLPSTSW
jgi:hypothetical protein